MERIQKITNGALTGLLFTAPLIAISYLANQVAGLPFPPFDLFDGITRVLPGPLVTFGIDLMIDTMRALNISVVSTAKTAEQLSAVGLFLGIGIVMGMVFNAVLRWRQPRSALRLGLIFGLIVALPMVGVTLLIGQSHIPIVLQVLWLLVIIVGWGAAQGLASTRLRRVPADVSTDDEEELTVHQLDRRRFLIQTTTAAAAITVVGTGLALRERRRVASMMDDNAAGPGMVADALPNADDAVEPAPGTRPEYTSVADFYSVFIRTEPSVVDGATWTLPITGLVDNPLSLTLDDLRNNYEAMDQFATLSCISGRVGTGLIGTTLWTGASLQDVLAEAGVQPGARHLQIQCADGYYETVDLDLINDDRRIMLTYAWDENPLSTGHGFPLRIYIPGRYGMKQPRWIISIQVIDEYIEGYWVERGWDKDAIMQTTSVIDTVATDAVFGRGNSMRVPIGGIAHGGARGISRVEIRVDGGEWVEAELRAPLSELTWVIWRYDWPFEAGNHTFEVRCVEADGTRQIEEARPQRPSGSRGIHSLEANV